MIEFFNLEQYVQNELMECDFLEQQAKLDYDYTINMIRMRRDYAKLLQKEIQKEGGECE